MRWLAQDECYDQIQEGTETPVVCAFDSLSLAGLSYRTFPLPSDYVGYLRSAKRPLEQDSTAQHFGRRSSLRRWVVDQALNSQ